MGNGIRFVFLLSTILLPFSASFAQADIRKISPPDSIRKMCDRLILSEVGEEIFRACVRFDTCVLKTKVFENQEIRKDYLMNYLFEYPKEKKASVRFSMNYTVSAKKNHLHSEAFYRTDKTDLPANVKINGVNILSYGEILNLSLTSDSILRKNEKNVSGIFILAQRSFLWHLSFRTLKTSDQIDDAEMSSTYNVIVNPYSGKIEASYFSAD